MKPTVLLRIAAAAFSVLYASAPAFGAAVCGERSVGVEKVFTVSNPDFSRSPYTGMTRRHWREAAEYLLEGAFSYIHSLDDPMYFPKQIDKTYPHGESDRGTARLEGLARTLILAGPLLRENPGLKLCGVGVADYYRHQIKALSDPASRHYVRPRGNGGPSQTMLEIGTICTQMKVATEALWTPLSQEEKDRFAELALSYGNGPSIDSNWMFFNVFILSFMKEQGYAADESLLRGYLEKLASRYRGEGWYNDAPAYDYYSMWDFQSDGPMWAAMYGEMYPEIAGRFFEYQAELPGNYPYMFSREGKMNMWGRSVPYRFASVTPMPLLELGDHPGVNYGWMRRIASATLLQFLSHPDFLENGVPSMGFYGQFDPCVQIYSCRGSVYWCGKAFLGLMLPEDSKYWSATENNGPWEQELLPGKAYDKFQPATGLMITNYANSGASEMRSWCHESVAADWQKFRSSENYNKLAYSTEFPWMADGKNGEVSMNYATLNANGEWEVLRLYDFMDYTDGVYRRDAVLETDSTVRYQLADVTLADGILRIDRVSVDRPTQIRLGHYSLPQGAKDFVQSERMVGKSKASVVGNGEWTLATVPLAGWSSGPETVYPEGLHPVSRRCAVPILSDSCDGSRIYATLHLWKRGSGFSDAELSPVRSLKVSADGKTVTVKLADKSVKTIKF